MKFKIKVGKKFEMDVETSPVKTASFSLKKAVTIFLVTVVFGSVVAAAAYGFATGDYAPLKEIAKTGQAAVAAGVEHAASSSK